jgi:hypothetical protein
MQCAIVELRQYTLHPGRRDELIELFEREFLEAQEAAGMALIGQFRVRGKDDRFVWLRGFKDMRSRAVQLAAFYDGPVWAAHRAAANATMIDSDNVLLVRPAHADSGFSVSEPFPSGSEAPSRRAYVAGVHSLREPPREDDLARVESAIAPGVNSAGGSILAWHVSEHSPNSFPRLPVREGENVVVWFAAFPDASSADACLAAIRPADLERTVTLRLIPTLRSRLR